ncbi:MAG: type III pantothenate kinase [Sumerlaeia bacterium]
MTQAAAPFLAIDIGNTHTVFGVMDGDEVRRTWRIATRTDQTSDELAITLRFLDGLRDAGWDGWCGAALCSVVPAFTASVAKATASALGIEPVVLTTEMKLGLENRYTVPSQVGMDRLADAAAASERYGPGLAIVDFGTATTINIVDREGDYLGGAILAGVETTADALYRRASKLPQIAIQRPEQPIGRNSVESMQSGLYYGAIDAVEGVIRRAEAQLGYELKIVATGGLSRLMAPDMARLHAVEPNLTLRGIRRIWARNAPAG